MADKLFRVKVKAPLVENGVEQERLIRAENVNAVTNYLLDIKKATPEDVAFLMSAGIRAEGVGN